LADSVTALSSSLCCSSLDEQYIAVLNDIVLTLCQNLTFSFDARFIALLLQDAIIIHNRLNERLLKIAVNNPRRLGRFRSISYRPLPHLVGTSRKEASQIQCFSHCRDNFGECRPRAEALALLCCGCFGVKASEAFFEADGYGDYRVGVQVGGLSGFYPFGYFGEVLVLLTDVVFL